MRFKVLGPLTMMPGRLPSAPKQRQLLALLLLHANTVVTIDDCVDELWGEQPPHSAHSTLQTYVMNLRRVLRLEAEPPGGGRIVTRERGYALHLEPGELDLEDFQRVAGDGSEALAAGRYPEAARLLRAALDMWRGPALVDVQAGPILRGRLDGLREVHLAVQEERVEADLRIGRHRELLGELRTLVRRHPTHENLCAQLALALYRSGRTTEALAVLRQLRTTLGERFGLEPSRRLQRLERAVLRAEPALDLPAASSVDRGVHHLLVN
ncbi:AfsR/SARP family transcriptional regulator [Micromonospora sp. NPDC003241]